MNAFLGSNSLYSDRLSEMPDGDIVPESDEVVSCAGSRESASTIFLRGGLRFRFFFSTLTSTCGGGSNPEEESNGGGRTTPKFASCNFFASLCLIGRTVVEIFVSRASKVVKSDLRTLEGL